MAWVVRKGSGYLVRWRDERRKTRSRYFADEATAVALKHEKDGEATLRQVLSQPIPWELDRPVEAADSTYSLEGYLRSMITSNRDLRETTRALYLRNLRVHIEGKDLGRADVRSISPEMLTAYWGSIRAGPGALRNVQQLLSMAFRRAVQTGLIDVNPLHRAPEVKKPSRRQRAEVVPLTVIQIEALADAARTPRDRLEILIMAYGGLRAGEVGGLRVQDVDFQRSQLHLRQQAVRVTGRTLVSDLKTDAARRVVTLPRSVVEDLRAFIQATPPAEDGRIFHGIEGSIRDHIRINKSVQDAAKGAGIQTHAHALRHTAVSLWIEDGANPIDVQHMIGHSDIKMTLGQYGHWFSWGGEALAASMERRRDRHRNGR